MNPIERIKARLHRMRVELAKSEQAAAKIARARKEAEEVVAGRWSNRGRTAGANWDYAVQRELDESPVVRGLIATDQLARDRAQMYSLQATGELLEHLVVLVERLDRQVNTDRPSSMSPPVPHQRHAG